LALAYSRRRRIALVLVLLVTIPVVIFLLVDRSSTIGSYRVSGDRTIVLTAAVGPGSWTRLGSVVETSETVTVTVRSFHFQWGAGPGYAQLVEIFIALGEPLGDRTLIDGSSGIAVPRQQ
jgi:hypothetical protein